MGQELRIKIAKSLSYTPNSVTSGHVIVSKLRKIIEKYDFNQYLNTFNTLDGLSDEKLNELSDRYLQGGEINCIELIGKIYKLRDGNRNERNLINN